MTGVLETSRITWEQSTAPSLQERVCASITLQTVRNSRVMCGESALRVAVWPLSVAVPLTLSSVVYLKTLDFSIIYYVVYLFILLLLLLLLSLMRIYVSCLSQIDG